MKCRPPKLHNDDLCRSHVVSRLSGFPRYLTSLRRLWRSSKFSFFFFAFPRFPFCAQCHSSLIHAAIKAPPKPELFIITAAVFVSVLTPCTTSIYSRSLNPFSFPNSAVISRLRTTALCEKEETVSGIQSHTFYGKAATLFLPLPSNKVRGKDTGSWPVAKDGRDRNVFVQSGNLIR